ncbi:PEP-CTERM sorting domain-containing protein [Candidatus Uabimicrobium amorphum]|uniref:Ice-binding protein C-terminal domain-containing protein n=1 Tax=Uabimicrobium amorphum TaxID=2596890 RepID=A0A5S9IR81_UABAM|nr:PEP-CTERM sorting domain-containing protein [Candidatus Uabimicrobium amorphum]BBM86091.1 hypothetical protein UABAM_04477 [Candidatus Uabimicrobium amorphum]
MKNFMAIIFFLSISVLTAESIQITMIADIESVTGNSFGTASAGNQMTLVLTGDFPTNGVVDNGRFDFADPASTFTISTSGYNASATGVELFQFFNPGAPNGIETQVGVVASDQGVSLNDGNQFNFIAGFFGGTHDLSTLIDPNVLNANFVSFDNGGAIINGNDRLELTVTSFTAVSTVPEPSTYMAILLGFAMLFGLRRKNNL